MSAHFVDKTAPDFGYYQVFRGPLGYRWQWREVAKGVEYLDCGEWREKASQAYRDAADDWESNGNSSNRRLGGQLRGAGTRAEKQENADG